VGVLFLDCFVEISLLTSLKNTSHEVFHILFDCLGEVTVVYGSSCCCGLIGGNKASFGRKLVWSILAPEFKNVKWGCQSLCVMIGTDTLLSEPSLNFWTGIGIYIEGRVEI